VECTDFGDIPRNREVTHSLHFIWINFYPVFRDDMCQVCNTVGAEGELIGIYLKAGVTKCGKDLFQRIHVLFKRFPVNNNVIEVKKQRSKVSPVRAESKRR
jgi:hypothetical protein